MEATGKLFNYFLNVLSGLIFEPKDFFEEFNRVHEPVEGLLFDESHDRSVLVAYLSV